MLIILLQSDATLFFGRFHSLTVHLPIGFILLGAAIFFLSLSKKFQFLSKAIPLVLLLSTISAIASVVLGLFLANEGGYPEGSLFWHRLLGIVVALLSLSSIFLILGYFDKSKKGLSFKSRLKIDFIDATLKNQKKELGIIISASVICISITGHLGGNLTHGENYLFTYAPELIQDLFINSELENNGLTFPEDADSTLVFDHIIQPILIQKCASCHDSETQKGGLQVTSLTDLMEGGETGPAFEEGSPSSSELYKRVTLDPKSKKYMPPKGAGLSYGEITLLKYWIENGTDQKLAVTNDEIPIEIKDLLESSYGLSTRRKAHYEKIEVAKVPEETLNEIRQLGFRISSLSEENNFLEIVALGKVTKEKIEALKVIQEQITWLDLGDADIENAWLEIISGFPNLTRLLLDNNSINDQGTSSLENLKNLESINLYNTGVGDSTLNLLAKLPALQSAYLWKTKVSRGLVEKLSEQNPKLKVDLGFVEEEKESK
ncbi:c-type cytochrome domain-containing protein [Algoriphagus sp.]|uniref:c-type cytochrome domain-containing protein n=1 Tax=Algoriphagus sp. TaxID=1872435 RepID=UPI0025FB913A|nr:c-type cytochrome domain-containing protein [Algoriphagus sp.]